MLIAILYVGSADRVAHRVSELGFHEIGTKAQDLIENGLLVEVLILPVRLRFPLAVYSICSPERHLN